MILDFVVKTIPTVALGIVLSIGAVYLIDKYLGPIGNPLSQLCQPLTCRFDGSRLEKRWRG
jgi:hypothetical protein